MATEPTAQEWQEIIRRKRAGIPLTPALAAKATWGKGKTQTRGLPYDPEQQLEVCSKLLVQAEERGHDKLKQLMVRKVAELKQQTGRPLSSSEKRLLGQREYSAREIRYVGQYTGGK